MLKVVHALVLGNAGAFLLLLLREVFRPFVETASPAVLALAGLHAFGQFKPVVARELLYDRAKLQPVMGNLHRLHVFGVDARPDRVAVFARDAVLVFFFVENHGARLADEFQAALGAFEKVKILLAGEAALRLVGIEGQAVKEFLAFGAAGLGGPFGKSAGKVLRDGAPDLGNLDPVVVERVQQVDGQLLPTAALVAFQDHMRSSDVPR